MKVKTLKNEELKIIEEFKNNVQEKDGLWM